MLLYKKLLLMTFGTTLVITVWVLSLRSSLCNYCDINNENSPYAYK